MFDLQKATFTKRISAYLCDIILFFIAVVGIGCIMSAILGYDGKLEQLQDKYQEYAENYGIDLGLTDEEYEEWTDEEKAAYEEKVEAANRAIAEDEELTELYGQVIAYTILIVTISTLISFLVLEFAIPIFIGNGQTVGKKIFSVALMRTDGVKISTMQLFVRSILGKYTLELMIPLFVIAMMIIGAVGIIGVIVLLAILVMEIVCYVKTGTNSFIHDVVAVTVCVDYSSQMIFESEEELIEYKKQVAAEAAENKPY